MTKAKFRGFAATEKNENWKELISREGELYARKGDVRSPFTRDYTRLLHSLAYRRLKHKTQVFFNIDNDHICTRMEHVAHVESVSATIAKQLGLNTELTKAIAIGHDIGHAPFGHHGEIVLNDIVKKHLGESASFWHERNGLWAVDKVELLENDYKIYKNLALTYAVRDGIIAHCGEIDISGIRPRQEFIDLQDEFILKGKYEPITWEGCVVKISDRIAYVGRDIEDAICLGFMSSDAMRQLAIMARENDEHAINTTVIMNNLIMDICKNSSPDRGICLSEKYSKQLQEINRFNTSHIYRNERLKPFKQYSEMIIRNIFSKLLAAYDGIHTWEKVRSLYSADSPTLVDSFSRWLARYCDYEVVPEGTLQQLAERCENEKIYGKLETKSVYIRAIIDYISGMTDRFAIKIFNEFLSY